MTSIHSTTFVDANVLLDVILPDRRRCKLAEKVIINAAPAAISTLSVHIIVYFASKASINPQEVRAMLEQFDILGLLSDDTGWAFNNMRNDDFEDALQVAVAIRNGCSRFVTFDRDLYEAYKSLPNISVELAK